MKTLFALMLVLALAAPADAFWQPGQRLRNLFVPFARHRAAPPAVRPVAAAHQDAPVAARPAAPSGCPGGVCPIPKR